MHQLLYKRGKQYYQHPCRSGDTYHSHQSVCKEADARGEVIVMVTGGMKSRKWWLRKKTVKICIYYFFTIPLAQYSYIEIIKTLIIQKNV